MGRCGCGSSTCQCSLSSTACLAITGTGTSGDPFLVAPVISTDAINRLECRANGLYASMWGQAAAVNTAQTTASTTYTDLATSGPAASVTTGVAMLVIVGCIASNGTGADGALMSAAISGATTVAASDNWCCGVTTIAANEKAAGSKAHIFTGLTPGVNVATAKYRADTGGTASFNLRELIAIPINILP